MTNITAGSDLISDPQHSLENILFELKNQLKIIMPEKNGHYLLNDNGTFFRLAYDSIFYIEGAGKYSKIYYKDEKRFYRTYLTSDLLCELETKLDNHIFLRCHKSYVVNLTLISKCTRIGKGGVIDFDKNEKIPQAFYSKKYKDKLISAGFIK